MFGFFRAGRIVAAATLIASLFAAPAMAGSVQGSAAPAIDLSSQFAPQGAAAASHFNPQVSRAPAETAEAIVVFPPEAAPAAEPQKPRSLSDLVISFVDYGDQDEAEECLAKAVYFEARSEPLEGQLAVAEVVLNRASSGRYPPDVCSVVTQPAQFSFIRGGQFPRVNEDDAAWRRALAIADIAMNKLARQVEANVLWYHATYVAPSWGRRLTRVAKIGTHIFYN